MASFWNTIYKDLLEEDGFGDALTDDDQAGFIAEHVLKLTQGMSKNPPVKVFPVIGHYADCRCA